MIKYIRFSVACQVREHLVHMNQNMADEPLSYCILSLFETFYQTYFCNVLKKHGLKGMDVLKNSL